MAEKKVNKNKRVLSIITPAYHEQENLPVLYEALHNILKDIDLDFEWIIIDDHSDDKTFEVISMLTQKDKRVHGIRFARNLGSHTAIMCGLQHSKGDCAVIMAADLQDPPETLPDLLAKWHTGAQVVWATRAGREGETASTKFFAKLYYILMRRVVGMKELPPNGSDFFLIDRCVIDALCKFRESHVSLFALIAWMGFRQDYVEYVKQARLHGESGWSLKQKLKLLLDSVTSFSYMPIRVISYLGFIVAFCGFIYAFAVINDALTGNPVPGWASLMVVLLVIGGMQMLMMGVLGEYIWRALDESRRRPRYVIEDSTNPQRTLSL